MEFKFLSEGQRQAVSGLFSITEEPQELLPQDDKRCLSGSGVSSIAQHV